MLRAGPIRPVLSGDFISSLVVLLLGCRSVVWWKYGAWFQNWKYDDFWIMTRGYQGVPVPPLKTSSKRPYYNKRQQFISIFFAYLSVFNYLGNPSNLIMNTFLVSTCFYIIIEFRCPAEFLYLYREFGGNLWIRDGRGQLACDLADSAPALEYFKQYLGKWLWASWVVFIPWHMLQRTLCPWWVWAGWQYDMQSEDPGSMTYVTLRFPRNSSILYCSKSLRLVLIKVQFSSDRLTHMIKMHGSIAILQYWNPLNLYSLYHLIIWK